MRRWIAILPLAACSSSLGPTLTVGLDDQQRVAIALRREEDHVFIDLSATINGVEIEDRMVDKGLATFIADGIDGTDAQVIVRDSDEVFEMDLVGLLAPRHVTVDRTDPLHAGDTLVVSTGVPTDALYASAYVKRGDDYCLLANDNHDQVGSAKVRIPDLTNWKCDPVTAGTTIDVTLEVPVMIAAPITSCSPDLTCVQGGMPEVALDLPAALQF